MAALPVQKTPVVGGGAVWPEGLGDGIDARLAALPPVALAALRDAALLDRIDTKFVCSVAEVAGMLDQAGAAYGALTIDGHRSFRYRTTYYDDAGYRCFRDHLAGRPVRAKVRVRRYLDAGQAWLEVKQRTAAGRTRKYRVPMDAEADPWQRPDGLLTIPVELSAALPRHLDCDALRPVLDVAYLRSTLRRLDDQGRSERVTLDRAIAWSAPGRPVPMASAVIVELKQAARDESPWRMALRMAGIRPTAVSKYCVGMAALGLGTTPVTLHTLLTRLRESIPPSPRGLVSSPHPS